MELNGVTIDDTYAEAFPTWVARPIITAVTEEWAYKAAVEAVGFATSTIGCPAEAGIDCFVSPPTRTPPDAPGVCDPDLCEQEETENTGDRATLRVHPHRADDGGL